MGTSKRYFSILSLQDKSIDDLVTHVAYCVPFCALYFLPIFSLVKYLVLLVSFLDFYFYYFREPVWVARMWGGPGSLSAALHLTICIWWQINFFPSDTYLLSDIYLHLTICIWWQNNFFLHNHCASFFNGIYWKVVDMNYLGHTLPFHQHNAYDSLNHNADMICINLQECGATVDC